MKPTTTLNEPTARAAAIGKHVAALRELLLNNEFDSPKTTPINLRVDPERKKLLQLMAELSGESVSEYLLKSAIARAQRELEALPKTTILVSHEAYERLLDALDKPPLTPSAKAKELLAQYRATVVKSSF